MTNENKNHWKTDKKYC